MAAKSAPKARCGQHHPNGATLSAIPPTRDDEHACTRIQRIVQGHELKYIHTSAAKVRTSQHRLHIERFRRGNGIHTQASTGSAHVRFTSHNREYEGHFQQIDFDTQRGLNSGAPQMCSNLARAFTSSRPTGSFIGSDTLVHEIEQQLNLYEQITMGLV